MGDVVMFTEHLVMSQGRHGGSESMARAPCGSVLGCGVAVGRAPVWAAGLCTGARVIRCRHVAQLLAKALVMLFSLQLYFLCSSSAEGAGLQLPISTGKAPATPSFCPPAQGHKANPAVTPHCSRPFSKIHVYFLVTVLWVELLLMLCIIDTEMLNTKKQVTVSGV